MTDKIFKENPRYSREALVDELENLFFAELVIIPWDRYEMYGHADGMVRWIDGDRVLMNNYFDFDPSFRKKLVEALPLTSRWRNWSTIVPDPASSLGHS